MLGSPQCTKAGQWHTPARSPDGGARVAWWHGKVRAAAGWSSRRGGPPRCARKARAWK
jgi:hypothetical protein